MEMVISKDQLNSSWSLSNRGRRISLRRAPIASGRTKIFAMGSCFANEIRRALQVKGFDVYPAYAALAIDPQRQILAKLHEVDNISHYDTFAIRQEFEQAFARRHYQVADFFELEGTPVNQRLQKPKVWQDPQRKLMYGADEVSIQDLSARFDDCVRQGIEAADVYILTLGLIEVWKNLQNGKFLCRPPGSGYNGGVGRERAEFRLTHFQENYDNIRAVVEMILGSYPNKHIVFSVSPVALQSTWTGNDIIVANTYSKAVLRAVAGQILADYGPGRHVHYMPAFEIAQNLDIFHADGRHVTPQGAEFIVNGFMAAFLGDHAPGLR